MIILDNLTKGVVRLIEKNQKYVELINVDVFITSECIHLYISYCISLYPDGDVCSSDRESH